MKIMKKEILRGHCAVLAEIIRKNKVGDSPAEISVGLHKYKSATQKRYFKVFAGKSDITAFVAIMAGFNLSNAKDTKDCLIASGGGMDMGFHVVNKLAGIMRSFGFNDVDEKKYSYRGMFVHGDYSF